MRLFVSFLHPKHGLLLFHAATNTYVAFLIRINATEDLARSEKIVLDVQRAEFQKSLQRLETEKKQLASRVEENGRQSQAATEAVKEQLAQEKLQLQQRIAKMEAEKAELAQSLASSEQMVKAHADELAHQVCNKLSE